MQWNCSERNYWTLIQIEIQIHNVMIDCNSNYVMWMYYIYFILALNVLVQVKFELSVQLKLADENIAWSDSIVGCIHCNVKLKQCKTMQSDALTPIHWLCIWTEQHLNSAAFEQCSIRTEQQHNIEQHNIVEKSTSQWAPLTNMWTYNFHSASVSLNISSVVC